jgi:hypothetical protein
MKTDELLTQLNRVLPFHQDGDRWVAEGGNALLEDSGRAVSLMVSVPSNDLQQVMRLQGLMVLFLKSFLPQWDGGRAIAASLFRGLGQDDFLIDGRVITLQKIPGALLLTVYREAADGRA